MYFGNSWSNHPQITKTQNENAKWEEERRTIQRGNDNRRVWTDQRNKNESQKRERKNTKCNDTRREQEMRVGVNHHIVKRNGKLHAPNHHSGTASGWVRALLSTRPSFRIISYFFLFSYHPYTNHENIPLPLVHKNKKEIKEITNAHQ